MKRTALEEMAARHWAEKERGPYKSGFIAEMMLEEASRPVDWLWPKGNGGEVVAKHMDMSRFWDVVGWVGYSHGGIFLTEEEQEDFADRWGGQGHGEN